MGCTSFPAPLADASAERSRGSGSPFGLDPVEVDTEPFTRVEVLREWHHIDVLVKIRLKNEEWVIENKVRSTQSQGATALVRSFAIGAVVLSSPASDREGL